MTNFDLSAEDRDDLWKITINKLEEYYSNTRSKRVSPTLNITEINDLVKSIDFNTPQENKEALLEVFRHLENNIVHTPHPKYFGLYNPRINFASILSDVLLAVYNPQLAAWSHAPYAVEIEKYLILEFCKKFGYKEEYADGTFCTGGAEANLTAILCALNKVFPEYAKSGAMELPARPIIYVSAEGHHSIQKAVRTVGLGVDSVRSIGVDDLLKMNVGLLTSQIRADLLNGYQPLMIVATAGTTGSGAIDRLEELYQVASDNDMWYHVDAAYGGSAILNSDIKKYLKGIELADSIAMDTHKWLSVGMGTSMFLTSQPDILHKTFGIHTDYMPREAEELEVVDPYAHSIQWSRRFIGFKVFLSLLFYGWQGYNEVIGTQTALGHYFRNLLLQKNWTIHNQTPFPVICFSDDRWSVEDSPVQDIVQSIIDSGMSWISAYPIKGIDCFRVCITNYKTTEADIDELILQLEGQRAQYLK